MPNGYGSVYKLPGNRRRPWAARVTTGWTEEGKQEFYYIGYRKTRAEAMDLLADYNKNPIGETRDTTFGEIYERWSAAKYPKLTRGTTSGYKLGWARLKALEDEPIRNIKKSHLQEVVEGMVGEGLSRSALEKTKTLAVILFNEAMEDEIIQTNFGKMIELPPARKAKKEAFTDLEIATIEKAARAGDIWAGTIMILVYSGMRIGELVKLTKFSIDTKAWTITGGIKSDAGRDRVIPIHSKIQEFIQYWLAQPGDRLISRDGQAISTDYYRASIFYPALERIEGVRRLTPHATRHTFASLLARAKAPTKQIQDLIGHSDYATTANIYTHTNVEELRAAIESI